MTTVPKMSRTEWNKTPYAATSAKDTVRDIDRLFVRYKIQSHQIISGTGPSGRQGFAVQFTVKQKMYRIGLECLPAVGVEQEKLVDQVKRAVYFQLKTALEACSVFFRPEEILFPYLVMPNGTTVYQAVEPHLDKIQTEGFKPLLALPAPERP